MSTIKHNHRGRSRAEAQAIHPATVSKLIPIWTPADAVDTAQQFALELDNAERGRTDKPHWTAKLFGRSRFRRAKVYDGLAVALLMTLMACLGVVVFAASAKASPDPDAVAYAAEYGPAVCSVLDEYPSFSGMMGIAESIVGDGLSVEESGQVIALSIVELCPRHEPLLNRFIATYGHRQVA